jgi:hypothetical protein
MILQTILLNPRSQQNHFFVDQCGFFPAKFDDFPAEANADRLARGAKIAEVALGPLAADPRNLRTHRLLGGLGSHDLAAMRDLLGMPKSCFAAVVPPLRPSLPRSSSMTASPLCTRLDSTVSSFNACKTKAF